MTHRKEFIFFKISLPESPRFFPAVLIAILSITILSGCSASNKKQSQLIWTKDLPVIGSQSSPRTADLNNDGILDIVIGAGKNEFQHSDIGILAFDGKSGNMLWKQDSPDQVFGSSTFCDVTGDKVKDVFIGGRSPQLKAINGKSGAVFGEYNLNITRMIRYFVMPALISKIVIVHVAWMICLL